MNWRDAADRECAQEEDGSRLGDTRAGWLFAGVWLVYLLIPLVETWNGQYSLLQQLGGIAGFWVFCYAYTRLVKTTRNGPTLLHPDRLDRRAGIYLATLVLIAAVLAFVSSPDWYVLWIYVSSACGAALPFARQRWAMLAGAAATGALAGQAALVKIPIDDWGWMILPSLFSCVGVVGVRRMRSLIAELHQARQDVKDLAVNEERLRLARDLHDLAGHSMATITLKAELARRLLAADPQAAEAQVADIERVSRQALADIREAVSGYRRPTLAVETASARTALEAAGIAFEHDMALALRSGRLDPDAEAALAWCLREAVTNVVRHSGASRCVARLIEAQVDGERTLTLEVTDDGAATGSGARAGAAHGPGAANGVAALEPAPAPWGNGLTGLRERLAPFSASLRAAPLSPHGFRLTATLPLG